MLQVTGGDGIDSAYMDEGMYDMIGNRYQLFHRIYIYSVLYISR